MSGDEAYVRVPVGAFKWLMGEEGDFVPPPDAKGNFWWRSEFQRRIKNFAFCWTPPIRQEQQAIDRALWSEIGLAIGRIEAYTASRELTLAKLMAAIERLEKEAAGRYDRLLSLISILHDSAEKSREGFEAQLVQRLNAIEREMHLINGTLGINYYPHMCRDGHQQIGHSDSEHEMCPLCREIAKNRAQSKRKRERKHRKAA